MRYTIVTDNLCTNQRFRAEWGFSGLLETPEATLLFDTGESPDILAHNLAALHNPPVDHIVLSHGHDDHCGALHEALRLYPQAQLWGAATIARERLTGSQPETARHRGGVAVPLTHALQSTCTLLPKVQAILVPLKERELHWVHNKDMWEVTDGHPRPDTFADDLSLLVNGPQGFSLLLGCAHTGLPNIFRYIKETLHIQSLYAVVGGTHLSPVAPSRFDEWIRALEIIPVCHWFPCHCTGFPAAARLAAHFPSVQWAGTGTKISL